MYTADDRGRQTPEVIFFINSIIRSIYSFAASFSPLNDFKTVFPIQTYNLTLYMYIALG